MAEYKDVRDKDQFKYKDFIAAKIRQWEEYPEREKEARYAGMAFKESEDFLLFWDTLKALEKKFGIDPWGVAREERWKHAVAHGQRLAKKVKTHGTKDLYDVYNGPFEALVDATWLECNDTCFQKHNHKCPCYEPLKELGKTDEEIAELAPLFCLSDIGNMTGFNPEMEIFIQPRLLCKGDDHCTYRWEDHRKDKSK